MFPAASVASPSLLLSFVCFFHLVSSSTTFKWVKSHQLIQIIGTGGLTLAGFGLAVAAVAIAGERQFGGSHQVLGLVITIIIFVQMAAGIWVHRTYDPKRVRRPARNWGHMIMGMGILVAAYVNLFLGVHRWVEGKTWMYAVFGAWAVVSWDLLPHPPTPPPCPPCLRSSGHFVSKSCLLTHTLKTTFLAPFPFSWNRSSSSFSPSDTH